MDCGGFLVKGSRPPSVTSSTNRPSSSHGNHHGYHTVSRISFADESLFGSAHQPKINGPVKSFKAPWECPKPLNPGHTYTSVQHYKAVLASKKEKPKDSPLLWCPTPGSSKYVRTSNDGSNDINVHWNTRSHFRHLKHTPTFVDESLFGQKLQEPSFDAPWNNKDKKEGNERNSKPYLWDPSGDSRIQSHNGVEINFGERPSSASRRPKTAMGIVRVNGKSSSNSQPVWKP